MESISQIFVAEDFYVENPILYDCNKLPTSLPDGLLGDGKIRCVKIT